MTLLKAFEARYLQYIMITKDEESISRQLERIERKFNKHVIKASKRNKTNVKFIIKHTTNDIYQSQSFRDFITKMNNLGYDIDWNELDDYDNEYLSIVGCHSHNYTKIKISWKL